MQQKKTFAILLSLAMIVTIVLGNGTFVSAVTTEATSVTVVRMETFLFGGNMVRKQFASTMKYLVQVRLITRKIHRHLMLTFVQI